MTQLTLDKSHYPAPSPDPRELPEGVCPKCGGLGVTYKKPAFNGGRPSRPVQCPECGGTGKASMEAEDGR
jgi:DnaJ-class molecular chaperone